MEEKNILIQAGLSEEQALLYQSLLDKGPMRASDLAQYTGIKRGLVYKVLEQLENNGLATKQANQGAVAVFSPAHPSLLLANIERKERELSLSKDMLTSTVGSLASKYNLIAGKPNIQFFEGLDGVKKVLKDSLTSKTEIYSYGDLEAVARYIPEINTQYVKDRENLGIKKRGFAIDTPKAREFLKDYYPSITETKLIKQNAEPFSSVMQIYDGKISYITLAPEKMIGVIIQDQMIYQMHKYLFEHLWVITPELNPKPPLPVNPLLEVQIPNTNNLPTENIG